MDQLGARNHQRSSIAEVVRQMMLLAIPVHVNRFSGQTQVIVFRHLDIDDVVVFEDGGEDGDCSILVQKNLT